MSSASENVALVEFDRVLAEDHLQGQWQADRYLESVIGGPKPAGQPFIWRWERVWARLQEAAQVMPESFTARRHLGFMNPGFTKPGTTQTLWAGLQWVQPGEVAWAHRHSITALRWVVDGHPDAFTVVDGERCPMETGDLILTPRWSWHDHHNPTDRPVIWLDVLDVPLVASLNAAFYEPYGETQQPERARVAEGIGLRSLSWLRPAWERPRQGRLPLRYPWKEARRLLEEMRDGGGTAYDGVALEYCNPVTGGPTLPTMTCWLQALPPAFEGQGHRHTASAIYFVMEGEGRTEVEGEVLEWGPKDAFVVPNWAWHRHQNRVANKPAVLFVVHDTPLLAMLGLYYEEPEPTWRRRPTPAIPTASLKPIYRPDAFLEPDEG